MQPTTENLARISKNSLANKTEIFTKLYRYLLRPDLCFLAYNHLYANNVATTRGVNADAADGFGKAKIASRSAILSYTIKKRTWYNKRKRKKEKSVLAETRLRVL